MYFFFRVQFHPTQQFVSHSDSQSLTRCVEGGVRSLRRLRHEEPVLRARHAHQGRQVGLAPETSGRQVQPEATDVTAGLVTLISTLLLRDNFVYTTGKTRHQWKN